MEWTLFHAIIMAIAIPVAVVLFARAISYKVKLMQKAAPIPDPIADHKTRIRDFFTIFLGQQKLFQERLPGLMHAIIFWGFCILLTRAITLFGMGFAGFDFHLPFLGFHQPLGKMYSLVKDIVNVLVAAMVIYALWRRYIKKVPRLLNTPGALFVLLMILGLMISDMIFDGTLHASRNTAFNAWSPVGSFLGSIMSGENGVLSSGAIFLGHISYFFHCLGILVFLVYLPMGKHMHIVTSVFNVYLRPLNRNGRLTQLDLEDETIESFGVSRIEEYSWKDFLDLYTCTECGRCNDVCPAKRTEKELAPRELTIHQKHFLLDDEAERILAGDTSKEPSKALVPDVVKPEEIWACTTCQSCEQACPVNIGYVQRINALRRSEVLNHSRFPSELKRAFKGMETNNNPWGIGASTRLDWAKDLKLPVWGENGTPEYLLFLGCAAAFDDRAQRIAKALVNFLLKRNISFGVIGVDEPCCGETARRLGEEALGQMLMETNVELFNELGVKKILTPCPHCFNTFKNEYPDFKGNYEVIHHSQLIAEILKTSSTVENIDSPMQAVLHDSCYLGRINGEFDAPRTVVSIATGREVLEPLESREKGFCCGAGGGLFWLEESGKRINHERFNQLVQTGSDTIVTSCPYCLIMLSDAAKDLENQTVAVKDIVELL
ncbi:(Fe-S)-binding protein [bacterium]|nr:(Fe-S)-binding protein [candidate division CSSED10-310 bacterium]